MFNVFDFLIAGVVFVTIVAVAGIVADYKRRKMLIEPLRAAVERGQPLDPALIDKLMAPERLDPDIAKQALQSHRGSSRADELRIGGNITSAIGVGLLVVALASYYKWPWLLLPMLLGGISCLSVGVGLLLSARSLERSAANRTPPPA